MEETRAAARAVTAIVRDVPEVANVFVNGQSDTEANITVNLGQKGDRDRSSFVIQDEIDALLADFPDVRLTVLDESGAREIAMNVLGDTEESAAAAARELASAMNTLPEVSGASIPRP